LMLTKSTSTPGPADHVTFPPEAMDVTPDVIVTIGPFEVENWEHCHEPAPG
jgi:hypothetical protein